MEELRDHIEELERVLGCPIKYAPPTKCYNPMQCAVMLKAQMPGVNNYFFDLPWKRMAINVFWLFQVVKMLPDFDFSEYSFVLKRGSRCGPPEPFKRYLG